MLTVTLARCQVMRQLCVLIFRSDTPAPPASSEDATNHQDPEDYNHESNFIMNESWEGVRR
jgi:hypothetical protein